MILGFFAIAKNQIDKVDEVEDLIKKALNHIEKKRLVIAPDCGLGLLNAKLAEAKLKVMCEAVSRIN